MNVLVWAEWLPDPVSPNAGRFFAEQVKELAKFCRVTVISPVLRRLPSSMLEKERLSRIPLSGNIGRAVYYRPRYLNLPRGSYYLNDYVMLLSVLQCVLVHRIRFDLIHCCFAYRSGYVGAILGKLLHKPVVLSVVGSDVHQRTRVDFPLPLWRERTLSALRNCRRIIAISDFLEREIIKLGIPAEKTTVIPMGFYPDRFTPLPRQHCREALNLPVDKRILLSVGGLLREVKGICVLIEALPLLKQQLDRWLLVVVGDGAMRTELEQRVQELGMAQYIRFVGMVADEDVPRYMSACDLLISPSLMEGFGLAIVEAMTCGKPVVASRVGSIPEIVNAPDLGVLVEPGNPEELTQAVVQAMNRSWSADRLRAHTQQYAWDTVAERIYEVYRQMLL